MFEIKRFIFLFLFFLLAESGPFNCPGSYKHKDYFLKSDQEDELLLGNHRSGIQTFKTTPGGYLTFQFYEKTRISMKRCKKIRRETPRIFLRVQGEYFPFCQGKLIDYPLVSAANITLKYCSINLSFKIKIVAKMAGHVFAQRNKTQIVVEPKPTYEWINIDNQHQNPFDILELNLTKINLTSTDCKKSFIKIEKFIQGNYEYEFVSSLCGMENYFFQTYQFKNNCESINVSFKNVGFQFTYRTKPNITKTVLINKTKTDDNNLKEVTETLLEINPKMSNDKKQVDWKEYIPYGAGGVLACILIAIIAFVVHRRRNRRKNRASQGDSTKLVPNTRILQIGDGLHSINNMTYVSIQSVNTRQPRLEKVNFHCPPPTERQGQEDRDVLNRVCFKQLSQCSTQKLSDRPPYPTPKTSHLDQRSNYDVVPFQEDAYDDCNPYSTIEDLTSFRLSSYKDSERGSSGKYFPSRDTAANLSRSTVSGNHQIKLDGYTSTNKLKMSLRAPSSSLPDLLEDQGSCSELPTHRKQSLNICQPSYYVSHRPSDPDIQPVINPSLSRLAIEHHIPSLSTSLQSNSTGYYDSPRPSLDGTVSTLNQQKPFFRQNSNNI